MLELEARTQEPKRVELIKTQVRSVASWFSDRMDVLHNKLTLCTICTFMLTTGRDFKIQFVTEHDPIK